ncbi:MAG: bacterioferritin-associated ferredoxin [Stellaceae bacterium]
MRLMSEGRRMYICLCNAITDREFRAHAADEDSTVSTVYRSLGTKPQCGKCVPYVRQLLRQVVEFPQPQPMAANAT